MSERFTDRLRRAANGVWQAQHDHPFVRGIGDGTLDLDRFKVWVRQDYLFLIEYSRLFALAAARAPDLETMTRFGGLLNETLRTEMALHRSYAAELGVSGAALERERKAPTTEAYTSFLLKTAALGDFAELAAALLPCMWGYCEVGQRLAVGPPPAVARYRRWIEMYSSPEFDELAGWCRDLVDRLAAGRNEGELARMEDAFVTSSRFELLFWEMAWSGEGGEAWPA